ncbi:unnamed protein product [Zymoseptoria tritici ST99CH_3D1]|nr:unnamed protein product [Zymoseptoria tritici ST99CH_3D1]
MASRQILSSVPPALPPRNPRRKTRRRKLSQLTDEQHDLWEHAALLHHGYEWQNAATSFQYLAHTIRGESASNLCLLNAALVFARLGDYDIAAETLDGGGQTEELLPLTLYLMGHVELELKQNIEKARDCFAVALKQLEVVGGCQSFHHLGLEFTLYAVDLRYILEMLDPNGGEPIMTSNPGAIAVNGIFEAPSRSWNTSTTTIDTMNPNVLSSSFSGYSSDGSSTTGSPLKIARFGPRIVEALRTSKSTGSFKVFKNHLISDLSLSDNTKSFTYRTSLGRQRASKSTSRIFDKGIPPPIPSAPLSNLPATAFTHASPKVNRNLPPTPIPIDNGRKIPRSARTLPESTSTLASFIKNLPPQQHKSALQPRSAEGDFSPMREMTDFLRGTAPPGERAKSPAPLRTRKASPAPRMTTGGSSSRSSSSPPSSVSSLGSRSATPPPPPSHSISLQRSASTNPDPPRQSALRHASSVASTLRRVASAVPPKEVHPALREGFRLRESTIGSGRAVKPTSMVVELEGDIPVMLVREGEGRGASPVSAMSVGRGSPVSALSVGRD